MDKRVLRERMRRKKRQMMIRHYTKIGLSVLGLILAIVFVVRGIIIPIAHHVAGGGSSNQTVQAQADTEEVQANSDAAVRQPLKGKSDTDKISTQAGMKILTESGIRMQMVHILQMDFRILTV